MEENVGSSVGAAAAMSLDEHGAIEAKDTVEGAEELSEDSASSVHLAIEESSNRTPNLPSCKKCHIRFNATQILPKRQNDIKLVIIVLGTPVPVIKLHLILI